MIPADLEILIQQGEGNGPAKPVQCGDGFFWRQGLVA